MSSPFTVHTSVLFNPKTLSWESDISITVDRVSGLIVKVFKRDGEIGEQVPRGDIDLRGKFVLPGFVDAHTHIFLHSYDERASLNQKRDESVVERILRAANHCRTALLSGYTTYRDLGSESMKESDAHMRDAINRGIVPGPRLFVATRVLASSGAYESRTENSLNGVCLPIGAHGCDGPEGVRRAVRDRIAAGADVIKFYADYRRRIMRYPPLQQHPYIQGVLHPPADPNPDVLVFDQEEMDMICREARLAEAPVAVHARSPVATQMAVRAGVTTVEHAYDGDEETYRLMKEKGTVLVPTLGICERVHAAKLERMKAQIKLAHDIGVTLACGGDTGTFPHGQGVREAELFLDAGIPLEHTLRALTLGGWEACGGDLIGMRFGWWEEGVRADIVAIDVDPREQKKALRIVSFVMKDGQVWKKDGKAQNMGADHHVWDMDEEYGSAVKAPNPNPQPGVDVDENCCG